MRKKRLDAHVGGWICEYQLGENGVVQSFQAEWIPFYGKEFYDDKWSYKYWFVLIFDCFSLLATFGVRGFFISTATLLIPHKNLLGYTHSLYPLTGV